MTKRKIYKNKNLRCERKDGKYNQDLSYCLFVNVSTMNVILEPKQK